MRWFRLGLGRRQVQHDPDRQERLLTEARQQFGAHVRVRFADQAGAVARLLDGDDGLLVAAGMLGMFADAAHADLLAQAADLHRRTGHGFAVDRANYRPLWRAAGPELRWPLFALPGGLHPYVQVSAAVTVIGGQARRTVRVTDPDPLLAHLFEVLDLTLAGWEWARVRVDTDAAALAGGLISTARELRAAMPDPPPLPPPVRELMRRNRTVDVHDPADGRIVGGINPGKEMREALLA
ncbi:hypothetical protein DMB66_09760 [Actinoplanes sp. ATCC 53533]|uniref:hypothetical protein n=1 Tax=Actinoplanes sp. ATCC 53533 TaxID=1288362 RepID=UPI000F79E46C|nr:hypothetical protein [Actinoplanes sp. ATCC 53533]RSM70070.1 hypothetical protein DMB66_09760 [Actinoplanes sp. ATCC 53533]